MLGLLRGSSYSEATMQPHKRENSARVVIQVSLIVILICGALNYDALLDQYALATYHPDAQLVAFQTRVTLTTAGKAKLYRSRPQFDEKATFNTDCDTQPHELELGCYFKGRIFVLQIANQNLAPEMDVVASHELLHSVWSSLSSGERIKISAELERVYALVATPDLKDRMAGYAKSEPGEEANELHSILGTEFAQLSPMLEAHYSKYFSQRSQIVAAHAAYQNVFDSRRLELEKELAQIRAEKAQLASMNRLLENYRLNGQIAVYNVLVPKQNALVDDINSRISTYSQGVDEYNGLSKSLDSQAITDTESKAQ